MTFNKRIDFKVDEKMYKKIKETAYLNNTSMSEAIRISLDIFFKGEYGSKVGGLNEKTLS